MSEHPHAPRDLGRWLIALYVAFVVEHAYGAARYGTPVRLVGLLPLGLLLVLALELLARHARTGSRLALSTGAIVVAVAFVGLAGLVEGGFNHALKLAFHVVGMPDDRLRQVFGGLNFAVPDDVVFEGIGTATLGLAAPVAWRLARLLRSARLPDSNAPVRRAGVAVLVAAGALLGAYVTEPLGHAGLITLAVLGAALGFALTAVSKVVGQAGRTSRIVHCNGMRVPLKW
ncbi:hypothetical protein OG598_31165 [Micromonospora sp. NBC_00330]|uniref:hypothetical protein n=1 Tax=Micromonospora sp. NBC_00330 TaxID=2903585 RepID=UPI002E2CFD70|nr:hypothetical protein [Micromonospora sp. NBC_00330]